MKKDQLLSSKWVNDYYSRHQGTVPSLRNHALNKDDLLKLIIYHKNKIYSTALYEEIAAHPNADELVHRKLLALTHQAESIVNAIATSGKASVRLLEHLLQTNAKETNRLHVRLALFMIKLKQVPPSGQQSLLSEVSGDDDYSVAARYLMAVSDMTNKELLNDLIRDDYEHIARAANKNITERE